MHPVRTNDAYRWLLSGSGFWLSLSPFLFFNSDRLTAGEVNTETVTLMGFGAFALIIAGMIHGRHHMVQTSAAVLLATGLGITPWLVGFPSLSATAMNLWATSWLILMITIHQAIRLLAQPKPHRSRYRKTVHQRQPIAFI